MFFLLLNYSELERLVASLVKLGDKAQLHNSGFLSLDPITDKTPIYPQVLQSYKWSAKVSHSDCHRTFYAS